MFLNEFLMHKQKSILNLLRRGACVASMLSLVAIPAFASEVTGTVNTGIDSGNPGGIVIAAPTFTPDAGTFHSTQSVTLAASGSLSIHYTTNGVAPTCSTGTIYASAVSVSSAETLKAISCYASGGVSIVSSAAYTFTCTTSSVSNGSVSAYPDCAISCNSGYTRSGSSCNVISSGGGGGGGGGGGAYIPVVTPIPTPVVTPSPSVGGTLPTLTGIQVLSALGSQIELLGAIGGNTKPADDLKYLLLLTKDAKEFKISLTPAQLNNIMNFVVYGDSDASIKLGEGERRAVIRDYFETVGRPDVVWTDIELLVTGQKPIKRNMTKEQAMATQALAIFKKMVGHAPNFKVPAEDIAWNTLMYRIRFPRDLAREQAGITEFKKIFKHTPVTPLEWATVRALGYALN